MSAPKVRLIGKAGERGPFLNTNFGVGGYGAFSDDAGDEEEIGYVDADGCDDCSGELLYNSLNYDNRNPYSSAPRFRGRLTDFATSDMWFPVGANQLAAFYEDSTGFYVTVEVWDVGAGGLLKGCSSVRTVILTPERCFTSNPYINISYVHGRWVMLAKHWNDATHTETMEFTFFDDDGTRLSTTSLGRTETFSHVWTPSWYSTWYNNVWYMEMYSGDKDCTSVQYQFSVNSDFSTTFKTGTWTPDFSYDPTSSSNRSYCIRNYVWPFYYWSSSTYYYVGQFAYYNGVSYQCIQAGSNHLPTDAAYWTVLGVFYFRLRGYDSINNVWMGWSATCTLSDSHIKTATQGFSGMGFINVPEPLNTGTRLVIYPKHITAYNAVLGDDAYFTTDYWTIPYVDGANNNYTMSYDAKIYKTKYDGSALSDIDVENGMETILGLAVFNAKLWYGTYGWSSATLNTTNDITVQDYAGTESHLVEYPDSDESGDLYLGAMALTVIGGKLTLIGGIENHSWDDTAHQDTYAYLLHDCNILEESEWRELFFSDGTSVPTDGYDWTLDPWSGGFYFQYIADYYNWTGVNIGYVSMIDAHSFPWVFKFQLTHKKV